MPPMSVERRAEIALRALSMLRAESGWQSVSSLADKIGAKAADVRDVLVAARLAGSADWTVDLEFSDELEPPPFDELCVRLPEKQLDGMPLPVSDIELLRTAFTARLAADRQPGTEQARLLESVQRKVLASLGLDEALDLAEEVPVRVLAFQEAREQGRAVAFDYLGMKDQAAKRRVVTPLGVTRSSKAWMLESLDHERGQRQFREDRVIGELADAGEARTFDGPIVPPIADATKVRLRLPAERQWAVQSFQPEDATRVGSPADQVVEVTITVFPPVDQRLLRLFPLLGPQARVVWPVDEAVAEAHRERLRQVIGRCAP